MRYSSRREIAIGARIEHSHANPSNAPEAEKDSGQRPIAAPPDESSVHAEKVPANILYRRSCSCPAVRKEFSALYDRIVFSRIVLAGLA